MKILFHLGHPAHFHLFKNTIVSLRVSGHIVTIAIKSKDILENLLIEQGFDYINILPSGTRKGKLKSLFGQIEQDYNLLKYCLKNRQDLMLGSSIAIAHIGKILGIPSVLVGEDDANIVPKSSKAALPFATLVLSPHICSKGKWEYKKIGYNSYQKLAYLHPNYFTPDKNVVEKYFSAEKPYFIIRFAKLNAHHDAGIQGINAEIAQKLIDILKPHGDIYITSERELEPRFEHYRLNINLLDIHHVMAFASIYIGDSQSMAVEAAMLGVPSIRFNDFAGKIGVLEELEHKYHLTSAIKPSEPGKLYQKIEELLRTENLQAEFQNRRQKMLSEKIDTTAFFTWFIENYPESKHIMQENPDYQYNFK